MAGVPANAGALVGKRLGNYELVALLALGGTAEIYLARIDGAAGFEKYVVVKCLHDHLAEDHEFVQMFLDEARLGAQLDHSNIVQTLGLGEHEGRYYLVMEFIAGMSLALLARRAVERVPGGRIPVHLVLGIAAQACAGLHYAHTRQSSGKPLNLVHRDISPQNIVVTFEGDVRIVDFGIAKAEERETATKSGTIKGKFAYMSPEQCHAKQVDARTDVFALGVVVHELLTGRRLFKRGTAYETYQAILECKVPAPSAVNHELDPALDAVVMKALTKSLPDRYASAEAFGEALTKYLHSRGKLANSSDISAFIGQHFAAELDDHGDRMRELLEGRPVVASGWDDAEPGSTSMRHEDAEELSQFEVIEGSGVDEVGDADPEDAPVDATRIEMNPMALMAGLEAPRPAAAQPVQPAMSAQPAQPAQPAAKAPMPARPLPSFGSSGASSSIFGGPAPTPAAATPAAPPRPALPPLGRPPQAATGRPTDKTAPTGLPSIGGNRAKEPTAPAPTSNGFSEAPATVISEPPLRTPPGMRSFASAPEARTVMAAQPDLARPPSRDLPASFEAVLSDESGNAGRRNPLAYGATVPAMDAMAPAVTPSTPPIDQPTYRAPFVDPLQPMGYGAPEQMHAQPYPSGELLVPPHGTPPATSPIAETSLPAHLIGLPPPTAYPRFDPSFQHPKLKRELPGWIIPVGITVVAVVVIGVIAAVAG